MRARSATIQKVLLGLALLAGLAWNLAHASEIKALRLTEGATGTRAEISLDGAGEYTVIRLSNPERLVIDLPSAGLAKGLALPAGSGVVKAVRTGKPVDGTTRIVFDLAQPVAAPEPWIEQGSDGPRLVVEWPGDGSAGASAVATVPAAQVSAGGARGPATGITASADPGAPAIDTAASAAATTRLISQLAAQAAARGTAASSPPAAATANVATTTATATATKAPGGAATSAGSDAQPAAAAPAPAPRQVAHEAGMRPLVIAIDPGHGGQDPGAIGKNGTREKDVVLAIGKELARQINATPGLKAYLTRDNDVFIPLNQRARLARKAGADMFISIHADAAENRNADGSSVYVLSLRGATSQRARWLADKENSADLVGGVRLDQTNDTLASVLLDLTQSGHMKASEDAARDILSGLQQVGNVHKRNVEKANFAVLRTSDMPAMLVETAFISNPDEEQRLRDPAFQRKLAGAVLDGVNGYFSRQPPPGTLYAARAAAQQIAGAAGGSP
ncbi:N-acetylmuramoyl-L-alanine amidase [Lysobacter sp. GX 14042]|uniref:N-acetylmuramoyl-L-alanine amidase n=1 Tax=Lysobacter sp. GX 14042 TaxID=2907155 RepID=UPI001F39E87F|nr:N-acetylmuramoyl-L-alanine amidase [Lysobacter sp. GX 14042]MCE7032641.1 N-acetylmuramoyl-L-alanine amidase [Lysobacter sp. GX 14042]